MMLPIFNWAVREGPNFGRGAHEEGIQFARSIELARIAYGDPRVSTTPSGDRRRVIHRPYKGMA